MAQLDTGLGWSAKEEWLLQSTGEIARVSAAQGELPVIANPTFNDIALSGVTLWYNPNNGEWCKAVAANSGVYGFASETSSALTAGAISTSNASAYYYAFSWSTSVVRQPLTIGVVNRQGWYYRYVSQGITTAVNPTTDVPKYTPTTDANAEQQAVDAIMSAFYSIEKINQGYAVCCMAKWRTSANVVIASPVLISSISEYTDMSVNGSFTFAKLRIQRDGMPFYMSFYQDLPTSITSILQIYDISGEGEPYANLDELFNLICAPDQANVRVTEAVDPYEDFPYTEEDSGETDPDPEDDEIEEEDLPTMSFATAGFCRIYRPDFSQVSALARYLWTDQTFLQTVINHLKQIIENPIDAIISLSIVPCTPPVLADDEVKVMFVPTGVSMPPIQRQFVSVDCGSYKLNEMYGSALDYNPYTSVQLYLPYIGVVQLDTDEVMGKTISIGYRIDVVTGVCCAYVKANNDVLYQFSGHCSIHQPITSADFSGYINAALAAGKLVASVAAAGAGAPAVAATLAGAPTPSISGTESKTVETERNPNTGRQITVGTRKRESQTYNPGASFGEIATRGVSNTVGAVMNSKTIIQHSGGFSGNSGFMAAVRRPYLIVTRPRIANPENYGKYNGRPSMIYLNLGECTGFTQVQSIQLTGIDATNPELSEIATLLNSGVIL